MTYKVFGGTLSLTQSIILTEAAPVQKTNSNCSAVAVQFT